MVAVTTSQWPHLPLGKKPARPDAIAFKMARYISPAGVTVPAVFGHQSIIPLGNWGMLGNDQWGDCVEAGTAHETMLFNGVVGKAIAFSSQTVLKFYSEITGFNASNPNTDQGTDMADAVKYRQKTGIADDTGKRHKIGAYLALKAGDVTALAAGAYLFGAVGFGFNFPESAMDQFNDQQPWDVVKGSRIEGGHYVPVIGRLANGNFLCVTWGELQQITPAFVKKYNDESFVAISQEMLDGSGKSPEGFDLATLTTDLSNLGSGVVPDPNPPVPPEPQPTDPLAEILSQLEALWAKLRAALGL